MRGDDGRHLALYHCGRLFRVQLRGEKFICGTESDLAAPHGYGLRRLYDRLRGKRLDCQEAGRGQRRRGKPDLFHAGAGDGGSWSRHLGSSLYFHTPSGCAFGSQRPNYRRLCAVRAYSALLQRLFYAPVRPSEFSGGGGEAEAGISGVAGIGDDQRGAGFPAGLRVSLRPLGRGAGYGAQPGGGRADSHRVFPAQKFQPFKACAGPHGLAFPVDRMYQRFLGDALQPLQLGGQHAV